MMFITFWPLLVFFGILGLSWILVVGSVIWQFIFTPGRQRLWADWLFVLVFITGGIILGSLWLVFYLPIFLRGDTGLVLSMFYVTLGGTIAFGVLSLPFILSTLIARTFFKRGLAAWFSRSLLLLPLIILTGFLALILRDELNTPHASDYFQLHAAIKNTCLLDPKRDHCPTKLEEISYIEPVEFKRQAAYTDFFYTYDAPTNQYTFIARYDAKHAVVFDQRLIPSEGVDFKEYEILTEGQDHLINPPPFAGPWTFPEWNHVWGR